MAKKEKESKPAVERLRDEDRKDAIDAVFKMIKKEYGTGSIMKLGDSSVVPVEAIPTGSLTLDMALGVGGLPRGRIVEIYGPESSGKTTVALHVVAEAQKMGGEAAFIDAEHALDPIYAKALGVDIDNLIVAQPDTGEQALDICEALVRSGALDIIVVDSVAALVPKMEIEGEMGDNHVGLLARLMSQALRKLTAIVSRSRTIVIFINQLRDKVGVVYGSSETTPGGNALKFFSSVRLDVRRKETIKNGTDAVGSKTRVKVVKNKVAPPFKEAFFDIMYGKGISKEGNILDVAVENDIIKKSGAWFSYNGEKIGQGRDNVCKFMMDNVDFTKDIERQVREALGIDAKKQTAEPEEKKEEEDKKPKKSKKPERDNADEPEIIDETDSEPEFSIDEMNEIPE